MMRRRYGEWILGMFAAGVILGTAAVNLGGEDFREQAGGMAEALFAGAQASRGAFWELLRMTAPCRAGDAVLPSRGLCGGLRGSGALGVHLGIRGCRAGILPGNPVSPFSVLPAAVAVSGGERRPSGENPREVSGGGISPPGGGDFLRNGGKSGNSFIFFAVKRIQHVEEWGFPGQHVVFFM